MFMEGILVWQIQLDGPKSHASIDVTLAADDLGRLDAFPNGQHQPYLGMRRPSGNCRKQEHNDIACPEIWKERHVQCVARLTGSML